MTNNDLFHLYIALYKLIIHGYNHKYNHIHIDIPPYTQDGQVCEKDTRRPKRTVRT